MKEMRIIAGKAKGMRLKVPKGYKTRPTSDRVKEGLFNIIQGREQGARVLDLFAGTGALGLEALSRGAIHSTFVENHPIVRKTLTANIEKSKMKSQAEIVQTNALSFLKHYTREPFDLIFLDPPYASKIVFDTFKLINQKKILNTNGLVIWEREASELVDDVTLITADFKKIKKRRYGNTLLLFYSM